MLFAFDICTLCTELQREGTLTETAFLLPNSQRISNRSGGQYLLCIGIFINHPGQSFAMVDDEAEMSTPLPCTKRPVAIAFIIPIAVKEPQYLTVIVYPVCI